MTCNTLKKYLLCWHLLTLGSGRWITWAVHRIPTSVCLAEVLGPRALVLGFWLTPAPAPHLPGHSGKDPNHLSPPSPPSYKSWAISSVLPLRVQLQALFLNTRTASAESSAVTGMALTHKQAFPEDSARGRLVSPTFTFLFLLRLQALFWTREESQLRLAKHGSSGVLKRQGTPSSLSPWTPRASSPTHRCCHLALRPTEGSPSPHSRGEGGSILCGYVLKPPCRVRMLQK